MPCTFEYTDGRNLSVWKASGAAHIAGGRRKHGEGGSPFMMQVQKGGGRGVQRRSPADGGVPQVLSLSPLATQPQLLSLPLFLLRGSDISV